MDNNEILTRHIPYRLQAVSTLSVALGLWPDNGVPVPMKIFFNDHLVIDSNSYGFLNPAIECGLMHCRALLEFLGLCELNGQLRNIGRRHDDDVHIEQFSNAAGPLPMVTPAAAVGHYTGEQDEAERALIAVFHATNKGVAHLTSGLDALKSDAHLIEIASRGVPSLVISHLYTPLGLPAPDFEVTSRHRTKPS
jgi:hypothetical protein